MFDISEKEVLGKLSSKLEGLSEAEAAERLKQFGFNEFAEEKRASVFKIVLNQFKDPLVIILIIAAFISGFLVKALVDSIVIVVILLLNAVLGFSQEYKAERAVALLKKLRPQYTRVIRCNVEKEILTKDLVPGDIIILGAGNKVPADCRLLEVAGFKTDESALTGESVPVEKKMGKLPGNTMLADRTNMVFAGTVASQGRAKAVVVFTGMNTELGKITVLVQSVKEGPTPLQKRLTYLGKWLGMSVIIIATIVFFVGLIQKGFTISFIAEMFMVALSLTVAAIPEGLPAVVTVCLALGLRRMVKKNALIRKLKSNETLGSITVICTDKTGTLTKNEMTVKKIYFGHKTVLVTGSGYDAKGGFLYKSKIIKSDAFRLLLEIGASCNDATLDLGDPTERALIVLAKKGGVEKEGKRIDEIPFDSDRKFMATMHSNGLTYVKGAVEQVLARCSYIVIGGRKRRLTLRDREKILAKNNEFAKSALRVLGMAYKEGKGDNELCFVGLAGMIDPPREEAKTAIELCKSAGIRPMMITGDHKVTAEAIGKEVGITGEIITGEELDKINDDELKERVKVISIFARTSSAHKVRILNALQENGEIVAMTGDGINDAPALKKADVGVAMNLKGTDVSRESSDMILLDDNFATIVAAIREGRVIYSNIKKFIKFLVAANLGEMAIVSFSILAGLPLPLLPLHILWINLVTDSLPAMALGVEPPEMDIMERKPRPPRESVFKGIKFFIVAAGLIACLASLAIFNFEYITSGNVEKARTMAMVEIIVFEMFLVFSCRSKKSLFSIGPFKNRYLLGAVILVMALQFIIIYTPFHKFFKLVPIGLVDWVLILIVGSSGFLFFEIKKVIERKF